MFFANKATLGAVMQIIQNRFVGFDDVFFLCSALSKTRSDLWPFPFHLQVNQVCRDKEQSQRRGSIFHARQQDCGKKSHV